MAICKFIFCALQSSCLSSKLRIFLRFSGSALYLLIGFLRGGVQGEWVTGEPSGFLGKIGEP